jgi:hypothetical protein
MLRSSKDLEGYTIGATDGAIGTVEDLYFDDRMWVVRYFVITTGSWLTNRKVLIAPVAIHHVDWSQKSLSASITQAQVRNSPDIDTDKPVSRQHEIEYLRYYNYPSYWEKGGVWSPGPNPNIPPLTSNYEWSGKPPIEERMARARDEARGREPDDPHLRSCNEVTTYHIAARDGEIGHACGLLVDVQTWAVRYLIVDTSNWWLGHKVLVAPEWIVGVDWPDSKINIALTRDTLKDAPTYDPGAPLEGAFEVRMFEYYGRAAASAQEANKNS